MGEPTSKVYRHAALRRRSEGGVGVSDGSCHNIPTTNHPPNSLIYRLRFQNDDENDEDGIVNVDDNDDEDDVYLQL